MTNSYLKLKKHGGVKNLHTKRVIALLIILTTLTPIISVHARITVEYPRPVRIGADSPFYRLKLTWEEWVMVSYTRWRRGEAGEAYLRIRLAERRLNEINDLLNRAKRIDGVTEQYQVQVNRTQELIPRIDPVIQLEVAWRLIRHIEILEDLKVLAPEEAYIGFNTSTDASIKGVETVLESFETIPYLTGVIDKLRTDLDDLRGVPD